jgi:hypothetical protein
MHTPALAAVLLAVTVRWSSGATAYPDCSKYPSYNNGGRRREEYATSAPTTTVDYGEGEVGEQVSYSGNGNGMYYNDYGQEYVEPWSPYNGGVPMPRMCTDSASNPRGSYTSNLAPCRLQFHKISNGDGADASSYELSTACSDENQVGKFSSGSSAVYEYVNNWPDECVGSFKRCYSVARDERVFISEVCRHSLVFPEGTTHVSLDCSDDRTMKQDAMDKMNNNNGSGPENDPYLRAQEKQVDDEIHETEKVLFVIIAVILVSCLGCLGAAYVLVVQPYQDTMKESRRSERDGLMMSNNDTDDETTATTTKTSNGGRQGQLSEVQWT